MAKILQIGMILHNMTLFKFICVQYQFHGQTLPIMKIDRGQIQFREYVSTGTEPLLCTLSLSPSCNGVKFPCTLETSTVQCPAVLRAHRQLNYEGKKGWGGGQCSYHTSMCGDKSPAPPPPFSPHHYYTIA